MRYTIDEQNNYQVTDDSGNIMSDVEKHMLAMNLLNSLPATVYTAKAYDSFGRELRKIGYTSQSLEKRLSQLKSEYDYEIMSISPVWECSTVTEAYQKEQFALSMFEAYIFDGEWMLIPPDDLPVVIQISRQLIVDLES